MSADVNVLSASCRQNKSQNFGQDAESTLNTLNHVNAQRENRVNPGVAAVVSEGIRRFEALLEKNGYESYDPYDIWGTRYGLFARRIYYEKGKLGLPLNAPILAMDRSEEHTSELQS